MEVGRKQEFEEVVIRPADSDVGFGKRLQVLILLDVQNLVDGDLGSKKVMG